MIKLTAEERLRLDLDEDVKSPYVKLDKDNPVFNYKRTEKYNIKKIKYAGEWYIISYGSFKKITDLLGGFTDYVED